MSYEGSEEYICEKGHYFIVDAYYDMCQDPMTKCLQCGGKIKWHHSIDETNGIEEGVPSTYPANIKDIGFEDVWSQDHYGNKYAVKVTLFAPDSPEWREFHEIPATRA